LETEDKKAEVNNLRINICYHDQTFEKLHRQLWEEKNLPHNPPIIRVLYWSGISKGEYIGDKALRLLDSYLEILENKFSHIMRKQSIAYWLHLSRRIRPDSISYDKRSNTILAARAVFDAALQKYGKTLLCNKIAQSADIPEATILRGELMTDNGINKMILEEIRKQSQLVLTDFSIDDLKLYYELEMCAFECYKAIAIRRAIGKGSVLLVNLDSESFQENRVGSFVKLISIYDKRLEHAAPISSATATVYIKKVSTELGVILLPQYNIEHTKLSKFSKILLELFDIESHENSKDVCTNFIWKPINLLEYYERHKPFDNAFLKKNGVSLSEFIAIIGTLSLMAVNTWVSSFSSFWHFWQRGYNGPGLIKEVLFSIKEGLPHAIQHLGLNIKAEDIDVEKVVSFLSHNVRAVSKISLCPSGPFSVFLPAGDDRVFIDYPMIMETLYYLFHGIDIQDQSFKGKFLENYLKSTEPVLPRICKLDKAHKKEIDNSFGIGSTLVIVECKCNSMSLAFLKGDAGAVNYRKEKIEDAFKQVDDKAIWLSKHPIGRNYNISKYRKILPIVVTPFVEYVHSLNKRYWLSEELPRVLIPNELNRILSDGRTLTKIEKYWNIVDIST
jgi:hypothetical protein